MVEQQNDEILVLMSAFGTDFECTGDFYSVHLSDSAWRGPLALRFKYNSDYPTSCNEKFFFCCHSALVPPDFEIASRWLEESALRTLSQKLKELFVPGELVVWPWIEKQVNVHFSCVHCV